MDWLGLNGGAGENLSSSADLDPHVLGYVGQTATTSDTQLMYDSQNLPPYEGNTNRLSLQYMEWLGLHNPNTVGLHPTYYSGCEPTFDSQTAASGQ